jgi:hypothetical protein
VADNGRPILLDGYLLHVLKVLHQNTGGADCTDGRDKVYGQLAMVDYRISDLCIVNYDEKHTFLQTMADFAIAVTKGVHRLDWIHWTWAVVLEEDQWPSWLPDFRIGKDGHHYRWASEPGDASKCDANDIKIDVEGLILKRKGYGFDTIVAITESLADMAMSSDGKSPDLLNRTRQ